MDDTHHLPPGGTMRRVPITLAIMLAAVVQAFAAPPDVPTELKVRPGQLVRVPVKTKDDVGTLKNFKDEDAFWGELVSPPGQRVFLFQAPPEAKPGTQFVIGWWTVGEKEGVATTITVTGTQPAPPDTTDPPKTGTKFYYMVVRQGGVGINTEVERVMNLPGWKDVKNAGHGYGDYPFESLSDANREKLKGQQTPFVAVWKYSDDKKSITLTDSPVRPFPTTDEAIRSLLK